MRPDRWAARLVHEVTLVLQVSMAQPVHKARRGLWVPLVQQAQWVAPVTPDPKVRPAPRVTTERLEQQVLGVRLVRLAQRVILVTPATPETPATGVRLVRWVIPARLVRRVTPELLALLVDPVF